MIKQLDKIIGTTLDGIKTLDSKFSENKNEALKTLNQEYFEKHKLPALQAEHHANIARIRLCGIYAVEKVFDNCNDWISYICNDYQPALIDEIDTLKKINLSPKMQQRFFDRYSNNYFAVQYFNDLVNSRKHEADRRYVMPIEDFEKNINQLHSDVLRVIITDSNPQTAAVSGQQGQIDYIASTNVCAKLANGEYSKIFEGIPYLNEALIDRPAPLSPQEQKLVDDLYLVPGADSITRTRQLINRGYSDLILRSEYRRYLLTDWIADLPDTRTIATLDSKKLALNEISISEFLNPELQHFDPTKKSAINILDLEAEPRTFTPQDIARHISDDISKPETEVDRICDNITAAAYAGDVQNVNIINNL